MEYNLPDDPVILLSYVNTQLRDHYASFHDFCVSKDFPEEEIKQKLSGIDYEYDAAVNQFV